MLGITTELMFASENALPAIVFKATPFFEAGITTSLLSPPYPINLE